MPEEYGVLTPRWLRGWIGTLTDVSGVVRDAFSGSRALSINALGHAPPERRC